MSDDLEKFTSLHLYPHLLRHTYSSWLIANGIDVVTVSAKMGHSNTNITLSTYAHWMICDAEKGSEEEKAITSAKEIMEKLVVMPKKLSSF